MLFCCFTIVVVVAVSAVVIVVVVVAAAVFHCWWWWWLYGWRWWFWVSIKRNLYIYIPQNQNLRIDNKNLILFFQVTSGWTAQTSSIVICWSQQFHTIFWTPSLKNCLIFILDLVLIKSSKVLGLSRLLMGICE